MHDANTKATGGYIHGEVKLAITLRLLDGGDALDLGVMFDITPDHCTKIMHYVLVHWVIKANIGDINMIKYLGDKNAISKASTDFSKRYNGVLIGAIGTLDGRLVRVVRPGFRSFVTNPVSFFSSKGFNTRNVQCAVDHKKKVLWF